MYPCFVGSVSGAHAVQSGFYRFVEDKNGPIAPSAEKPECFVGIVRCSRSKTNISTLKIVYWGYGSVGFEFLALNGMDGWMEGVQRNVGSGVTRVPGLSERFAKAFDAEEVEFRLKLAAGSERNERNATGDSILSLQ